MKSNLSGRVSSTMTARSNTKSRTLTPPFAFTEHGAIMLATILKSPRAIEMCVYVVRAFAKLREAARANEQIMKQLQQLE
jgi:hypothetical protein